VDPPPFVQVFSSTRYTKAYSINNVNCTAQAVALLAHVTTVNVLTAEPTIPAISAPIMAWFTNFGRTIENQSAMPGKERYPMNPIPKPRSQNEKIASPLDILD
jgi:hypothetical protein